MNSPYVGINVILEDPTEGKYDVPEIIAAASFLFGTSALLAPESLGFLGILGWGIDAAILAYELSPMPRGTTVHEADEYTKTAYVEAATRDENSGDPDAHDVSISPEDLGTKYNKAIAEIVYPLTPEIKIEAATGYDYNLLQHPKKRVSPELKLI